MVTEHEARDLLREQQATLKQAAAWLRDEAGALSAERYRIYPLAALFDDLSSHLDELPEEVRSRAVASARRVSGEGAAGSASA